MTDRKNCSTVAVLNKVLTLEGAKVRRSAKVQYPIRAEADTGRGNILLMSLPRLEKS